MQMEWKAHASHSSRLIVILSVSEESTRWAPRFFADAQNDSGG